MAFDATKSYQGDIERDERGVAEMLNSAYLQIGTTDPDSANAANEGVLYLNSSSGELFRDDGGAWVSVGRVSTTTAQTIAGKKTFTSKPVLPATEPQNNEAVSRSRADTLIANAVATEKSRAETAEAALETRIANLEVGASSLFYSPDPMALLLSFNVSNGQGAAIPTGKMRRLATRALTYSGTVAVTNTGRILGSGFSLSSARFIFTVTSDAPTAQEIDIPTNPIEMTPTSSNETLNVNIDRLNAYLTVYVADLELRSGFTSGSYNFAFTVGARLVGGS